MSSEQEVGASMDITGLIGQYAHGNEPSHHTTYMYAFLENYKIADKVRHINNKLYTDQPDGLSGNEDLAKCLPGIFFHPLDSIQLTRQMGHMFLGLPFLIM